MMRRTLLSMRDAVKRVRQPFFSFFHKPAKGQSPEHGFSPQLCRSVADPSQQQKKIRKSAHNAAEKII